MTSKKAQMQMGESIAIIVIVLFLIIFGLVFYTKIKASSIDEKKDLVEELDIVTLSQIAYSLPEVQCSFAEVTDYGCMDSLKLEFLAEIITNSKTASDKTTFFYYRELFGRSKISIELINNTGGSSMIYLYETDQGTMDSKTAVFMPLIVYNPLSDSNQFGVLIIEKYS